ncbi:MAG: Gfo/Idh/MocA family oxidoreductase [Chloroflexia bacterium]|nr:Gfo/Idh/MocA family oxidoreductase [Chloroflexia bacterium]
MTRKVGVGLIGCGSLSLLGILPQLALADAREQVELVAVCDVVGERARETAARFGVPHAYDNAAELIAREDVELVLVITSIRFHHEYAMAALRAGKHVYVQKTMATTYAEAEEMVETARERGLTLVAAPGQMLNAANIAMKRLVDDGALGDVYWAWGSTGGWYHDESTRRGEDVLTAVDPSWYYRAGGGPLRDVTVYVLHTLTGIFGPAARVTAMSGIRVPERQWRAQRIPVEVDDNSVLLLDFGGARFAVAGGHGSRTGKLLQWGALGIYGTSGAVETLEIEPLSGHPSQLHVDLGGGDVDPELLTPLGGDAYAPVGWLPHVDAAHAVIPEPHVYADIMHAVECIRTGAPPIASGEHAAHVVEIIEKGYLAAETGQTQTLESRFALPGV